MRKAILAIIALLLAGCTSDRIGACFYPISKDGFIEPTINSDNQVQSYASVIARSPVFAGWSHAPTAPNLSLESLYGNATWPGNILRVQTDPRLKPYIDKLRWKDFASGAGLTAEFCENCAANSLSIDIVCTATKRSNEFPLCKTSPIDPAHFVQLALGAATHHYLIANAFNDFGNSSKGAEILNLHLDHMRFTSWWTYDAKRQNIESLRCMIDPSSTDEDLKRTVDQCFARAVSGPFIFSKDRRSLFYLGPDKKLQGDRALWWRITDAELKKCGATR